MKLLNGTVEIIWSFYCHFTGNDFECRTATVIRLVESHCSSYKAYKRMYEEIILRISKHIKTSYGISRQLGRTMLIKLLTCCPFEVIFHHFTHSLHS